MPHGGLGELAAQCGLGRLSVLEGFQTQRGLNTVPWGTEKGEGKGNISKLGMGVVKPLFSKKTFIQLMFIKQLLC